MLARRGASNSPTAKVTQFAVVRRRDDDIGRFYVQMHELLLVDERQCFSDVQQISGQHNMICAVSGRYEIPGIYVHSITN